MDRFLALSFLSLCCAAAAQNGGEDPRKADNLRKEGVKLFQEKKFAEAATKYLESIAAYGESLGADSEACARETLVLRRAVMWCRENAGDRSHVAEDLEAFLKTDAAVLGNEQEEDSVIACLGTAMEELGAKKDAKGLESLNASALAALERWITAGAKDKGLDRMAAHLDLKRGGVMVAYAQGLYVAGERKAGEKAYREAVAYFEKRSNAVEAAWSAQNCFYHMSTAGTPEDAAFFFLETLAILSKREFAAVEAYLTMNARNYLKALAAAEKWRDGIVFLDTAIAGLPRPGVRGGAFEEASLRIALNAFLTGAGAWEQALKNADALGKLATAAKDNTATGMAETMAAVALLASGKPDAALPRADEAVKQLKLAGDAIGEGRARILRSDVLCALKKHDDAEKEAVAAAGVFSEIGFGPGLTDARKARLRNAKAKGDAELEAAAAADLQGVAAAGGRGGESLGTMEAADLSQKASQSEAPVELLEIRRSGSSLKIRNLLSNTVVTSAVNYALHYLNVDGVLLQVRGAEIAFMGVRDNGNAPGSAGESSMSVGSEITHTAPEFVPFAQRALATEATPLVLDSALQIRRKPAK